LLPGSKQRDEWENIQLRYLLPSNEFFDFLTEGRVGQIKKSNKRDFFQSSCVLWLFSVLNAHILLFFSILGGGTARLALSGWCAKDILEDDCLVDLREQSGALRCPQVSGALRFSDEALAIGWWISPGLCRGCGFSAQRSLWWPRASP